MAGAIDMLIDELLETAEITAPPVNSLQVARAIGLEVAWDDRQSGRARLAPAATQIRKGVILLRPEPRVERRQWAVAHEIGEHLAHRVGDQLPHWEETSGQREQLANRIASQLLLPTEWFRNDAMMCGWDLLLLKGLYSSASHELIARRMLDFGLPCIVTIVDQGEITFRQSSDRPLQRSLLQDERLACQRAHESGAFYSVLREVGVQAWPIHEPHWKREILRTVPADVDG